MERVLVNGEWLGALSDRTRTITNPATLAELGTVPDCSPADVDRAVAAARAAQLDWWKVPGVEKARQLSADWRPHPRARTRVVEIDDARELRELDSAGRAPPVELHDQGAVRGGRGGDTSCVWR